ncbi:MAG: sodium:proline symporter, partial [Ignavibacteria bacterium]|nr:sodium:proline symporter [Ignavibacteria bacterium]
FNIPESTVIFYVFGCMVLVAIYSALSGLWGVVITDAFQFILAMIGCIILAVLVVNSPQIGGMEGMQQKLPGFVFDFFPKISPDASSIGGAFALSIASFLAFIGIQWWASWYPGAEPGGGGYVAQRMMSAKDEKHSLFATLFFQVAHYALRPWPWIIVGLCSLILYPDLGLDEKKMGYIFAMKDFLPIGLKGLLVAAFFAAYMSTLATQLNWGTSYIINDFYRRFVNKNQNEKHYVLASKVTTLLLMVVSIIVTLFITRISGAWEFVLECGAGIGLVLILRWYWWRINAWSEISAIITPFIVYTILKSQGVEFPFSLFYLVSITTIVWLIVTYITPPTDNETLKSFYRRVHPGGLLWKKISEQLPDVQGDKNFILLFINWLFGLLLVYSTLFGIGKLLFGEYVFSIIYFVLAVVSIVIINRNLSGLTWKVLN